MDPEKATIQLFYERGLKPYAITKKLAALKISESKVYRVCRRLRQGQSIDNRHRSGKRRTVRTPTAIKRLREQLRRNPRRSQRGLASLNRMSKSLVQRIVKEDLCLYPYKKRRVRGLTHDQIQKRLIRSRQLIKQHGGKDLDSMVFSDEKLFGVEERLNSQNDRIYALSIEDVPEEKRTVMRFQNEGKIMVWGGVSKAGKFPLVFIESGVRINARYYIDHVLKPVVKEEGQRLYRDRVWTFQQDSAPAHRAKITQQWCRTNLPKFIETSDWPPSSPDLNPLDYSIWGILESRVNSKRHASINSLKACLVKEWDNLSMENIRAAIDAWPERLRSVVANKGSRFE